MKKTSQIKITKPLVVGEPTTLRECLLTAVDKGRGTIKAEEPPCAYDPGAISLPVIMTDTMAFMWLRLDHSIRWLVLDHLRRFDEHVSSGRYIGYGNEKSGILIAWNNGMFIGSRCTIEIEYRQPVKTRAQRPHLQIGVKMNNGKIGDVNIDEIVINRSVLIDPADAYGIPCLGHKQIDGKDKPISIDPAVARMMERVPEPLREDLMEAIAANRIATWMNHPLGNTSADSKRGFGFEGDGYPNSRKIIAQGRITDGIYYQKGRLMLKEDKLGLPETVWNSITVGTRVDQLIGATMNDGDGRDFAPLEKMEITKIYPGTTTMGRHKLLEMSPAS